MWFDGRGRRKGRGLAGDAGGDGTLFGGKGRRKGRGLSVGDAQWLYPADEKAPKCHVCMKINHCLAVVEDLC